jgi:hypothetical protein
MELVKEQAALPDLRKTIKTMERKVELAQVRAGPGSFVRLRMYRTRGETDSDILFLTYHPQMELTRTQRTLRVTKRAPQH